MKKKKLINDFGKLTGGKSKELITLVFSPSFDLKQKDLKYIQVSRGKIYKLKTNCIKTENNPFKIAVECEIDLSNISDGNYIISGYHYMNKFYLSDVKINIISNEIKLIGIKFDEYHPTREYARSGWLGFYLINQ